MKHFITLTLVLLSLISYSQKKKYENYTFNELISVCNISYKIPRGFAETTITRNNGHLYQYAIKDSATGFEVRYYIKPYDIFFKKDDTTFRNNPMTYNFFVSSLLNISGYILPNYPAIQEAKYEDVKYDFNADYGLSSYFEPKSKFGEGYKYCIAYAIRKDAIGEVYMFLLYNIINHETSIIIDDVFSSIDFK